MPAVSIEQRTLDALIVELNKIGPVGANWLTDPAFAEGVPEDPIPAVGTGLLYLSHARTEPPFDDAPTPRHGMRVWCIAWCIGSSQRNALAIKADVMRAVMNGEGPIENAIGAPVWTGSCLFREEVSAKIGAYVYTLELFADVTVPHNAP